MNNNNQTITTRQIPPCIQRTIGKTKYFVEIHFSATSTQSVKDKLKRVILHDLEHEKQGNPNKVMKNDEKVLDK